MGEALKFTFNTANKSQFISYITELALAIEPDLILRGELPFIISINGDGRAGKSLIWDTFIETLLGNIPKQNKLPSEMNTVGRNCESWVTNHISSNERTFILLANINSFGILCEDDIGLLHLLDKIEKHVKGASNPCENNNYRRLGDILLLNNCGDISSTMDITLRCKDGSKLPDWQREGIIELKSQNLQQSRKMTTFLSGCHF
jgi:hypothetical protein